MPNYLHPAAIAGTFALLALLTLLGVGLTGMHALLLVPVGYGGAGLIIVAVQVFGAVREIKGRL